MISGNCLGSCVACCVCVLFLSFEIAFPQWSSDMAVLRSGPMQLWPGARTWCNACHPRAERLSKSSRAAGAYGMGGSATAGLEVHPSGRSRTASASVLLCSDSVRSIRCLSVGLCGQFVGFVLVQSIRFDWFLRFDRPSRKIHRKPICRRGHTSYCCTRVITWRTRNARRWCSARPCKSTPPLISLSGGLLLCVPGQIWPHAGGVAVAHDTLRQT